MTKLTAVGRSLRDSEVKRLSMANSNLTEAIVMIDAGVRDETLVKFIENGKNLNKLHLVKFLAYNSNRDIQYSKSMLRTLKNAFRTTWDVNDSRFKITLEKK